MVRTFSCVVITPPAASSSTSVPSSLTKSVEPAGSTPSAVFLVSSIVRLMRRSA